MANIESFNRGSFLEKFNKGSFLKKAASRLVGACIVVLLVTLLAFLLSYLSPSDAAVQSFASMGIAPSAEQLAAKRAELGLDQPFFSQYLSWISNVIAGDFGISYRTGAPVADILFGAIPYTLALSLSSILLTLALGIPIGLVCAYKKGSLLDNAMRAITYLFNSIPSFFIALLLLYVFSVRLKMVEVLSTRDFSGMLLPTLALALPLCAWFSRQVRAYAVEEFSKTYVDGLRSRGVSDKRIMWVHVLRNISVPLLTLVGISLGMLLGGSAIVESIFSWPGLGFESIEAVGHRDYPFVGAYALTMAIIYLLMNALIDISYAFLDPTIKTGAKGGERPNGNFLKHEEMAKEMQNA